MHYIFRNLPKKFHFKPFSFSNIFLLSPFSPLGRDFVSHSSRRRSLLRLSKTSTTPSDLQTTGKDLHIWPRTTWSLLSSSSGLPFFNHPRPATFACKVSFVPLASPTTTILPQLRPVSSPVETTSCFSSLY